MMTVLESIKLSTEFFEKKGIESPRVNAEILLAHVMRCKRLELYLAFDKPLKEEELNQYREYLKRRARFEPLQYIVGEVEFYGIPFKVKPPVLIPRPETEILVETIINSFDKDNALNFLDIGTGTGNIVIALSKSFPNAHFTSIDINEQALELAQSNAEMNSVSDRIEFIKQDINSLENNTLEHFDVVISNPPYVSLNEYETLQLEITRFEDSKAITDNADGLGFYRTISEKSSYLLKEKGHLFFELGKGQYADVKDIMCLNGFDQIQITKDYLNIERVISGVKN